MSLKFAIPLAFAAACLPYARTSHGQTYTETGDAGGLPATAQVIPGFVGTAYKSITGTTTATNEVYDSDMYEITLAAPSTLTASTTGFVVGANNFDTQLFLFDSSGKGILANDDAAGGGSQSSLSTGSTLLAAGNYYLLIAGSGNYPADTSGNPIFPNFTTGADPTGTYAPTSTLPISAYTGNSNEGGKYVIALTIPEPSTFAALVLGTGGLLLTFRRRHA